MNRYIVRILPTYIELFYNLCEKIYVSPTYVGMAMAWSSDDHTVWHSFTADMREQDATACMITIPFLTLRKT